MGLAEYPEDQDSTGAPRQLALPSAFAEVEPLRMLFRGRQEREPESAFLQLYRVLEYFSVLQLESHVSTLRTDHGVSARAFLLEVQKLMGRDERAALGRLVARVADSALLARAQGAGLIRVATADALTVALYDFRNSVVHAKYDQRANLFCESVFTEVSAALQWRSITEEIAWKACLAVSGRLP